MKELKDYLYYHEDNPSIDILLGGCLEILPLIEKEGVIIIDPPWNVGKDYDIYKDKLSKEGYGKFIVKLKSLWSPRVNIVLGSEILKQWWDIFPDAKIIIIKLGAIVLTRKNNMYLQWKAILTTCNSVDFATDLWEDIRWPGEGYFYNEPRFGHPAKNRLQNTMRTFL